LHHAHRERLINVLSGVGVGAGFIHGNAHVGRGPRRSRVGIANSAHIPGLEVLFAFFAHR
jgi:hypothetical protein